MSSAACSATLAWAQAYRRRSRSLRSLVSIHGPAALPIQWLRQSPASAPVPATATSRPSRGQSAPISTATVTTVVSLGISGSTASSPAMPKTSSHSQGEPSWACSSPVRPSSSSNATMRPW